MHQQQLPKTICDESTQHQILLKLSNIVRTKPSQDGMQQLAQLAVSCDLSYASTLISTAKKYLEIAFKIWSKYHIQIGQEVAKFMKYLNYKIQRGQLNSLKHLFAPLKTSYVRAAKRSIPNLTDEEIRSYMHQHQKTQDTDSYVRQLITATQRGYGQYSTQEPKEEELQLKPDPQLTSNSRTHVWQELIFKNNLSRQPSYPFSKIKQAQNGFQVKKSKEWLVAQKLQELPSNHGDCGCCLSHVYEGVDLSFPLSRQTTAFFGSLSRCSQMQQEIIEQIVSFLNGEGGIILVGCQSDPSHQILPLLEATTQNQKDSIEARIQSYIGLIHPAVSLKRHVDLTFIPVRDRSKRPEMLAWHKGVYLLRIAVMTAEPQNTYFYTLNQMTTFAHQVGSEARPLKDIKIYEFMQHRYHLYDYTHRPALGSLRAKGNCLPTLPVHYATCHLAEKGDPDFRVGEVNIGGVTNPTGPGIIDIQKSRNPLGRDRQGFKFITLLVVSRDILQEIRTIFNQKQKIQTIIEPAFLQRKYNLSNNTWLVWHNIKFQKLNTGLKKQGSRLRLRNAKNPPILISTLNTVAFTLPRLLTPLEISEFQQLAFKYALEKIEHRIIDGYDYFRCPSIITAVLIYFHQTNKKQKSIKFVKFPTSSNTPSRLHRQPQDLHGQYLQPLSDPVPPAEDYSRMVQETYQVTPQVVWVTYDANMNYYQYLNNYLVYGYSYQNQFLGYREYTQQELRQVMSSQPHYN